MALIESESSQKAEASHRKKFTYIAEQLKAGLVTSQDACGYLWIELKG
jgi:rubrerythrin